MRQKRIHKIQNNCKYICILLSVILIALFVLSLLCGRYTTISFENVVKILVHSICPNTPQNWTQTEVAVVLDFRLPRVIAAAFVGAALAIAGATYQIVFSNPVASPDTLGVSTGAAFGAVTAILLGIGSFGMKMIAFAFGCASLLLVYFLTESLGKNKRDITSLLLIGMIISSVFSGLLSVLKYVADPESQLPQITYWLMGSFSNIEKSDLGYYMMLFVCGVVPLALLRWRINLLELDDYEAKSMGVNIFALRITAIVCATLLTSASTSITGGISWVGLFVPHIARSMVGNDYRKLLPISALLGAVFLLGMDDLARSISVNELPISILTSLVGAPLFFVVISKQRKVP